MLVISPLSLIKTDNVSLPYLEVAISPNTHEVQIFGSTGSGWQLLHTLTEVSP